MKVDVVATQPNPTAAFFKIVCCNALKEVEKQTRKKIDQPCIKQVSRQNILDSSLLSTLIVCASEAITVRV